MARQAKQTQQVKTQMNLMGDLMSEEGGETCALVLHSSGRAADTICGREAGIKQVGLGEAGLEQPSSEVKDARLAVA